MKSLPSLRKKHQEQIAACFDTLGMRIYSQKGIEEILASNWDLWQLPLSMRMPGFLDHLIKNSELKKVVLKSPNYDKEYVRYAWREISVYQLSLSIRPRSYLSHYSAMYLNNLTEVASRTIYVNSEQSLKFRD
jgi:hypothetical protein